MFNFFSVLLKMGSHQNGSQEEHPTHHYEKYHKRVILIGILIGIFNFTTYNASFKVNLGHFNQFFLFLNYLFLQEKSPFRDRSHEEPRDKQYPF